MNTSVPHRLGAPAFEPTLEDPARASVLAVPFPKKKRQPFKEIHRGSVTVKIYGRAPGPFMVAWRPNATDPRERKHLARLSAAENFADQKATELSNGETWRREFGAADYAVFLRCRQLAQTVNLPVELLVAEAVEARKNSRANIVHKSCPDLIAELLNKPRRKPRGEKWKEALTRMLESFGKFFTGPFHLVRAHDMNAWLDTIPGGLDYRFHHRAALVQLGRYAVAHNYAPRDWNDELKLVEDQGRAGMA